MKNRCRFIDSHKNPLPYIMAYEIIIFFLFFVFAICFSNSERWYVVALILANLLLPLMLRCQFDDKKTFDDLYDAFLTDILLAGIFTLVTAAELSFIKHFLTEHAAEDFKFIGLIVGFQKLPIVIIKIRRNIKEFKKN